MVKIGKLLGGNRGKQILSNPFSNTLDTFLVDYIIECSRLQEKRSNYGEFEL